MIGQLPQGQRRIVPILDGTFKGPSLKGRIVAGADWQLSRSDSVLELEARYTLETDQGDLIYVVNRGIRHGPPEVLDRLMAGEAVDPSLYYFRSVPSFETGAEALAWLMRSLFLCVGERRPDEVLLGFWRVL